MVCASGVGYGGVDGVLDVIGVVAMGLAIGSRGVWNLGLFSIGFITNSFGSPPTPSGVD